jgi:hypothetical protein
MMADAILWHHHRLKLERQRSRKIQSPEPISYRTGTSTSTDSPAFGARDDVLVPVRATPDILNRFVGAAYGLCQRVKILKKYGRMNECIKHNLCLVVHYYSSW